MMINLIATIDLKAVEGLEELHEGFKAPVSQVVASWSDDGDHDMITMIMT